MNKHRELIKAGLFDKDSDYDGMIGKAVQELLDVFNKQGHSGFSANHTANIFHKLVKGECLTPLLCDDDEWNDITTMCGKDEKGYRQYQNNRMSSVFMDGKDMRPYYLNAIIWNEDNGGAFTGTVEGITSRQYIKLPFIPKTFHIDVEQKIKDGEYIIKDKSKLKEVFEYYDEYKPNK